MDDGGSPTYGILIFLILILIDFLFFGFAAAMRNLNEAAVEKMAKDKDTQAKRLLLYMDKTDRYTHVCQLILLLVHMLFGFLEIPLWRQYFLEEPAALWVSILTDVLIFAVLIVLVLIVGIYTPEKVASRKPDIWAFRLVGLVRALEILFFPVIFLTDTIANLLSRVFGVDPLSDTDDVTEEEIISMVNEGHEQGVLLASEAEMIHNIFEFGDKEAKDIMTHRKNIIALDGTLTFIEALDYLKENNYSRFPVYMDDIDNIIGVLHIKEALAFSQESEVFEKQIKDIRDLVREVKFIPETRNINTLFTSMQLEKSHMVIVVDEYGQTAGIVAMEDILEEIVGNIEDEHDEEKQMIRLQTDGSYLMDGMADFSDVTEELELKLGEDEKDEFETLNGFLISLIDKIPSDDEVFSTTAYGYLFEILSVENKMIQTVRVTKLPDEAEETSGEKKDDSCQDNESMIK